MNLQSVIAYVGGDYGPTPGAAVNLFFRILLNLVAAVACWVPLRLFHKNGELAGASMVVASALLNFFYAVNAVLWPTDDIGNWPKGYGWCDIQLVLWVPLETLNAAAVCAVMHNIANQVSLLRASGLTCEEKRRRPMVQALILFPVPSLQIVLCYFVIAMRYNISGIIGCQAVFDPDWVWVFLVFFVLPCPLFAMAAAYFAVLTWARYRKIDACSRKALLCAGNSGNQARAARTRRKLYMMALTIVVPYCPMQIIFLFNNIRLGLPWTKAYDLEQLRAAGWDRLDYTPSTVVSFTSMYINYIAVLEVVVFFLYFGRTKEAYEMYRGYLRALGLAKVFPGLNGEWRPSNRSSTTFKTLWSRAKSASSPFTHTRGSSTSSNKTRDSSLAKPRLDHDEDSPVFEIRLRSLDLEAARKQPGGAAALPASPPPRRHPWLFRTPFAFPQMPMPVFFARSRDNVVVVDDTPSQNSLGPMVDALLTSSSRSSSRRPHWSATTTTTNSDDVAKAKVSHESIHVVSHWSSEEEDLSSPRAGWPVAPPCQMSPVETRYRPSFLASAYVPKRAVAGIHGACGCEQDLSSHDAAAQRAAWQQATFERGLISIKRDFASKD